MHLKLHMYMLQVLTEHPSFIEASEQLKKHSSQAYALGVEVSVLWCTPDAISDV